MRYQLQLRLMQYIERAMEFIDDPEVLEILERRFYKGFTYKQLICRYKR